MSVRARTDLLWTSCLEVILFDERATKVGTKFPARMTNLGRNGAGGIEVDVKRGQSAQAGIAFPVPCFVEQSRPQKPAYQLPESDLSLDARQMSSEAEVSGPPKREMPVVGPK